MKSPFIIDIIEANDGSQTIYVPSLDETYHSRHGSIRESQHVFIDNGLKLVPVNRTVEVFEVGLGTGLNAVLACNFSRQFDRPIRFTTIEYNPLKWEQLLDFNQSWLEDNDLYNVFRKIHQCPWGEDITISDKLIIRKIRDSWISYQPEGEYDIIFYDAFAPGKQPEMWDLTLLEKCYRMLGQDGILVTYCASGAFKRNLKTAGFNVETLQGPPGKKEMVRAAKS